jgi:hypothetical protein
MLNLIAVEGCTIQDVAHQGVCEIKSGLSEKVTVAGKAVLLDGVVITVSGGTVPGAQVEPVDVTLNAQIIQKLKFEGKCPIALNEVSSGNEQGKYSTSSGTVTLPIVLKIIDAGQDKVKGA